MNIMMLITTNDKLMSNPKRKIIKIIVTNIKDNKNNHHDSNNRWNLPVFIFLEGGEPSVE